MPSPLGHALGGIAAGWLVVGRTAQTETAPQGGLERQWPPWVRQAAVFGTLGALPDIDLLFGSHHTYTHSIAAVALIGVIAAMASRLSAGCGARFAAAAAAAYGSHLLLDWLGTDTTPPIGIMALWPFTSHYYEAPVHVFMAISRRYWLPEFWTYNLRALARELVWLVPLTAFAWWVRAGRRPGR